LHLRYGVYYVAIRLIWEALTKLANPGMDKNFWIALALSMVILLGYPYFLKLVAPPASEQPAEIETIQGGRRQAPPLPEAEPQIQPTDISALTQPAPPKNFVFETGRYAMEFSTLGGSVTRLAYKGSPENEHDPHTIFFEGNPAQPGIFGIRLLNSDEDLTQKIFKRKQDVGGGPPVFVYEKAGEYRLTKRYILSELDSVISLEVSLENLALPCSKN